MQYVVLIIFIGRDFHYKAIWHFRSSRTSVSFSGIHEYASFRSTNRDEKQVFCKTLTESHNEQKEANNFINTITYETSGRRLIPNGGARPKHCEHKVFGESEEGHLNLRQENVFRDPFSILQISMLVKPLSCETKVETRQAIDLFWQNKGNLVTLYCVL